MFKQDHGLKPRPLEGVAHDQFQHILIPACELGPDRYREFCASNPNWRPRSYKEISCNDGESYCNGCHECTVFLSKSTNVKPHLTAAASSGLSKGSKPISISVQRLNNHAKTNMAENVASLQAIHSPVVLKATQQFANNGVALQDMTMLKPPPATLKPSEREHSSTDHMEHVLRSNAGDDDSEHTDSGRIKASSFTLRQATASEHATSSEDVSEDTMTAPPMELIRLSEHAINASPGEMIASGKIPGLADSVRVDELPYVLKDEDLFKHLLVTRQIPYGHSYSNLSNAMQRRLHDYFKQCCPPCPHCNSNIHVKFRYFNNSGKSSLLQPRYSCRNPDTCVTIQEKTGKPGSRDFTLPKPKESEVKALTVFASHERTDGQRGRSARQPQMIQHCGSKRSAHNLNPLAEEAERAAKLPNTTLSLQTLSSPGPVDAANLQIVEASKAKALHSVKPAEDSNSSSSVRTASDEKTAINVRCQAVETSENGKRLVQPIRIQQVGSASTKTEAGFSDKASKGGKIAELNICMYIDLSTAS